MKPMKPMYVLILLIIIASAGFYGGMLYQKNQMQQSFDSGVGFRRFGPAGSGPNGIMPVRGQVVSTGNNSVMVKLKDGSSKIVDLTSQTAINKMTSGSASDLKSGEEVTAIGSTNSDGSITAQTVLLGNGMLFRRGGNQPGPTGQ